MVFNKFFVKWRIHWFCCLLLGVLFTVSCGNKQKERSGNDQRTDQTEKADWLITGTSAGIFEIEQPIPAPGSPEGYQISRETQSRYTESGPVEETIYRVSKSGNELLYLKPADPNTDIIGEIMITSDKFHTEEGIGIGSTIMQFIDTYPDAEVWYTYVSDRYIIEAAKYPIQFLLREKDFTGEMEVKSVKTPLQADDFESSSEIFKIRIF